MSLIQEALRRQADEDVSKPTTKTDVQLEKPAITEATPRSSPPATSPSPARTVPTSPVSSSLKSHNRSMSPVWALVPVGLLLVAGGALWWHLSRSQADQTIPAEKPPTAQPSGPSQETANESPSAEIPAVIDPAFSEDTPLPEGGDRPSVAEKAQADDLEQPSTDETDKPTAGIAVVLPDVDPAIDTSMTDDTPDPSPVERKAGAVSQFPASPASPARVAAAVPDPIDAATIRSPAPSPTPKATDPWPRLDISGILAGGSSRSGAVIVNNRIVGVGESIQEAKLIAVSAQQAEFEFQGERRTLRMAASRGSGQ